MRLLATFDVKGFRLTRWNIEVAESGETTLAEEMFANILKPDVGEHLSERLGVVHPAMLGVAEDDFPPAQIIFSEVGVGDKLGRVGLSRDVRCGVALQVGQHDADRARRFEPNEHASEQIFALPPGQVFQHMRGVEAIDGARRELEAAGGSVADTVGADCSDKIGATAENRGRHGKFRELQGQAAVDVDVAGFPGAGVGSAPKIHDHA